MNISYNVIIEQEDNFIIKLPDNRLLEYFNGKCTLFTYEFTRKFYYLYGYEQEENK